MKVRRFLARLDAWLNPTIELWLGCIILVVSARFWIGEGGHPIWDLHVWDRTAGAFLGPLLVYRAWKRKPWEVKCDTCGDRVPFIEIDPENHEIDIDPENLGRFYVIECPRCGSQYYGHERGSDYA